MSTINTDYCVVYCTCPDATTAETLARQLTELKLVACTNIVSHLTTIYSWEGKIVQGCEALMIIKTHQNKLADLEKAILSRHSYEFPEFIATPIIYGNSRYLQWVDDVVNK